MKKYTTGARIFSKAHPLGLCPRGFAPRGAGWPLAPGTGPGAGPGTGPGPVRVSNRSGRCHVNRGGVARIGRSVAISPQESRDPSPFCDMGDPRPPRRREQLPYPRRKVPKTSSLDADLELSEYLYWGEDRTSPGHLPPTPPRAPFPRPTASQARGGKRLFYSLDPYGERQFSYPPPQENIGSLAQPPRRRGQQVVEAERGPKTASTLRAASGMMGKSPTD